MIDSPDFKEKWVYQPIRIKGIIDNEKEVFIQRPINGEKGVEVVTPLYTNINDKGELEGIMVVRGWIPEELKDLKIHWDGNKS